MSKVEGLAKLRAKLRELPDVTKNEIKKALAENAEEIVAMARRLAPKKTGALAASIGWTFGAAPKGSMALAEAGEGDLRVTIYAGSEAAYYSRWIEFGTAKMRARAFFFPSYRSLRRRVRSRLTRATKAAARKMAATQ